MTLPQILGVAEINPMSFQIPFVSLEAYKCSLFPQTFRDWNPFHDNMISSAKMLDDGVSKFSYLLRARDCFNQSQPLVNNCQFCISPRTSFTQSQPLVKNCQFGISPVNYSYSVSEMGSIPHNNFSVFT